MSKLDRVSTGNSFKENLEVIKTYIEMLLKGKVEKTTNPVKDKVEEILKNEEPSFIEKLKGLFGGNNNQKRKLDKYESHLEDQDEYIPHDMEFGENLDEESRFAEISPGFIGYFTSGKKSYFDNITNLWSKKKNLNPLNHQIDTTKRSYSYAGTLPKGTTSIPLPEGSLPDINSIHFTGKTTPIFQIDQNNCLYITSQEKQYISFKFYINQSLQLNGPIQEDSKKIVFDKLTNNTKDFLEFIKNNDSKTKALKIKEYILKTKKYSTRLQGTLRDKSSSKNYISNLDKSDVLECFSANSLFVGLAREVGIPARLVVGHMVQSLDKDGKSLLSSNNGHAWSEIWNEKIGKWERIDATPTTKEDGSESNENLDQNQSGQDKATDSNIDQNGQGQSGNQPGCQSQGNSQASEEKSGEQGSQTGNGNQSGGDGQQGGGKSTSEVLEELIKKAKDDNLTKQAENLKKTIEKLEKASKKEEIRDILDKSGLTDFAKDMVDKVGNEEILKQEKENLKNIDDEKSVDNALENSLLDEDFKSKLQDYAREIKKDIQEQKIKMKSEMEKMGFSEEELRLYKLYKELEKELEPEVKKQIKALEKILPPVFRIEEDRDNHHKSGTKIGNSGKLVNYAVTGDERIFRRNKEIAEINEINMFETIIIDRSGSMGNFETPNSPLREAIKAAIIRAKVLEYFKVNFSIVIFDTEMEEIMEFGEKFSDKRKNNIPSRLMRAIMKSGGTDIGQPLSYVFESMKRYARKNGQKSFGNISFLGDGEPTNGLKDSVLKALIKQIRGQNFGLTAYYINGSSQNISGLQEYFGDETSGGTVVVRNVSELTEKLIGAYNENLRKIIKRYSNKN
nr:transglutaminase domain-containing protein [Candidatus Gracilibacteria bacterium]